MLGVVVVIVNAKKEVDVVYVLMSQTPETYCLEAPLLYKRQIFLAKVIVPPQGSTEGMLLVVSRVANVVESGGAQLPVLLGENMYPTTALFILKT